MGRRQCRRGPHSRKRLNRYNPNAPDWYAVHRRAFLPLPTPVIPKAIRMGAAILGAAILAGRRRRG